MAVWEAEACGGIGGVAARLEAAVMAIFLQGGTGGLVAATPLARTPIADPCSCCCPCSCSCCCPGSCSCCCPSCSCTCCCSCLILACCLIRNCSASTAIPWKATVPHRGRHTPALGMCARGCTILGLGVWARGRCVALGGAGGAGGGTGGGNGGLAACCTPASSLPFASKKLLSTFFVFKKNFVEHTFKRLRGAHVLAGLHPRSLWRRCSSIS